MRWEEWRKSILTESGYLLVVVVYILWFSNNNHLCWAQGRTHDELLFCSILFIGFTNWFATNYLCHWNCFKIKYGFMLLPCYQECCYPKVLGCSLIALLGRNVLGVFVEKILLGLDIILKGYLMVQRVVKTLNIVCSFIESNLCLWRHCNFTSISFLII